MTNPPNASPRSFRALAASLLSASALLVAGCSGMDAGSLSPHHVQHARTSQAAVTAYAAGNLPEAEALFAKASRELPTDKGTRDEGNFIYNDLQSRANLAWVKLASGQAQEAKQLYDSVFADLQAHESERLAFLQKHVDSNKDSDRLARQLFALGAALSPQIGGLGTFDTIAPVTIAALDKSLALEVAPTTPTIVGPDAIDTEQIRLNVLPTMGPLLNVGRIFIGDAGFCTASLVGPRLALTNAHCAAAVPEDKRQVPAGTWRPRGKMALRFEGLYLPDQVRVTKVHLPDGDVWHTAGAISDFYRDFAFLELDRHPVGRGWFGIVDDPQSIGDDPKFILAGHSVDLNNGRFLSMDWGCRPLLILNDRLEHTCRSWRGASGSPVLLASGEQRHDYILGLLAAGDDEQTRMIGPSATVIGEAYRALMRQAR